MTMVIVRTLTPPALQEVSRRDAIALRIEGLREAYHDIEFAAIHLDKETRAAALADVNRQIVELEQAYAETQELAGARQDADQGTLDELTSPASVDFGVRVRELRHAAGLTQTELVQRLIGVGYAVGQPFISQVEGGNKILSYRGILALARVLGADATELLQCAGLPLPSPAAMYNSATDVFFRHHNQPEPSAFDERLFAIEQCPGTRYLLYPIESLVSCSRAQIERQARDGKISLALWKQRRSLFEARLMAGEEAYHLHNQQHLLRCDARRGIITNAHVVELLQTLQQDLWHYPTFHLALAQGTMNLAFFLKFNQTNHYSVIAVYPRDWIYLPAMYFEGLCVDDEQITEALHAEFQAIWNAPATIRDRDMVSAWIDEQCARLSEKDAGQERTT